MTINTGYEMNKVSKIIVLNSPPQILITLSCNTYCVFVQFSLFFNNFRDYISTYYRENLKTTNSFNEIVF